MKTKLILFALFIGIIQPALADKDNPEERFKLPPNLKYVDKDQDDVLSLDEAIVVFDQYLSNSSRKLNTDLVQDVESTVIDIISYLEGVNCNDLKKTAAAKRFIEVYYANKFFDIESGPFSAYRKPKLSTTETVKTTDASKATEVSKATDSIVPAVDEDFTENIVTDRPDQTEAPQLTPRGFFQVEIGTQSEFDNDKKNNIRTQSSLFNTTLWKYGVTKNFELRLITEYASDEAHFRTNSDFTDTVVRVSGFNPVAVGSKIALQKEKGIIPTISLITHLELPYFGSEDYKPAYVIPRFRFLFAHTLNDRFTFSYNLGAEWEDGTSASTGIYTASLGASLFNNLSMFVEAYGFLKENSTADNRVDGGFTYLVNSNIQLDCSGGIGLSEISPDYFISAGISFRFNAFNKAMKKQKTN